MTWYLTLVLVTACVGMVICQQVPAGDGRQAASLASIKYQTISYACKSGYQMMWRTFANILLLVEDMISMFVDEY